MRIQPRVGREKAALHLFIIWRWIFTEAFPPRAGRKQAASRNKCGLALSTLGLFGATGGFRMDSKLEGTQWDKGLVTHETANQPGILELAKFVETKILIQLAEDTEAESLYLSLLPNNRKTGCRVRAGASVGRNSYSEQRLQSWTCKDLCDNHR